MRTPAATASRRRPWTSSAGWTLPACRISTPASAAGDPDIATASSLSRMRKSSSRPSSRARSAASRTPSTWAGDSATVRPPCEREVAVDVAVAHRVADVVEAAPGGVDESQRGVPTEPGDELGQHVVPAVHPAAVAPAGAGAAVLALDEHDIRPRREPLDRQGRPEPGEPAADDAHVRTLGGRQGHDVARSASAGRRPASRRPRVSRRRSPHPSCSADQPSSLTPPAFSPAVAPASRRVRPRPLRDYQRRRSQIQKPGGSVNSGCSRSKASAASSVRTQS